MIKVWHVGNFPNGKEVKRHRKAKGIINYEITCAFGQRLPKVYVK